MRVQRGVRRTTIAQSISRIAAGDLLDQRGDSRPGVGWREPSNERPSKKDAACISGQSQPEPSNPMSQILSKIARPRSEMF